MNNIFRKLEIFVIVVIIALIGIVYAFTQKPTTTTTVATNDQNQQAAQQVPTQVVTYPGEAGKNALELLKAHHQVEAKHYDFGDLVTGIDGISPDPTHFWAMYVNDQFSQVGASAYVTKPTDTVKWQIDAVDATK